MARRLLLQVPTRNANDERNFRSCYPGFASLVEGSFLVPGLETEFVPQGLTWLPDGRHAVMAYYSHAKPPAASRVAVVEVSTGCVAAEYALRMPDGR